VTGLFGPASVALLVGTTWLGLGGLVLDVHRRRSARVATSRLFEAPAPRSVPPWFERATGSVLPGIDAAPIWRGAVVAAGVVGAVLVLTIPVLAASLAAVVLVTIGVKGRLTARGSGPRRPASPEVYRADLVACLAEVHAALASGMALGPSLAGAGHRRGPCAADLALLDRAVRSGHPVQQAVDRWSTQRPGSGVDLVADALAIAGTTGASQAAAMAAVMATLRRRQAQAREARTLASQARASAAVLVALPIGFAVIVAILDPRISTFLVGTAAGWGCLIGGLVLDAAGAWWMAALVRRVR
jgi:tight adherence protein B